MKRLVATRNARVRLGEVIDQAEDITPSALEALLPTNAVHQGVAGYFTSLPDESLEDLIASGAQRLVVLDQISDPQNLGAIYRSAAAFGFTGLIMQTRHAPSINGRVAKVAVGALDQVRTCRVVNIARALEQLSMAGYHTVGLAGAGRSQVAQAVRGTDRLVLVLGAEGPGLRPGVARACAELASIRIDSAVESLNVSNAGAIAFYEAARASDSDAGS